MFHVPEQYRMRYNTSLGYSDEIDGNNGQFLIPIPKNPVLIFFVQASSELEWEHISITIRYKNNLESVKRTPTWQEMCYLKDIFWDTEDTVIQIHPPESQYVNCHPYCLHLWKSINKKIPLPDSIMVGLK